MKIENEMFPRKQSRFESRMAIERRMETEGNNRETVRDDRR